MDKQSPSVTEPVVRSGVELAGRDVSASVDPGVVAHGGIEAGR